MKRFLAFAGDNYYPSGGWNDFLGDADTAEGAVTLVDERARRVPHGTDWAHVVDTATGAEVAWWDRNGWAWQGANATDNATEGKA